MSQRQRWARGPRAEPSAPPALHELCVDAACAAAVQGERQRMARDLHDAVSQTLYAAHVQAGLLLRADGAAAWPQTLQRQARRLEQLTQAALAEVRMLMLDLRPDALAQTPMAELLQQAINAVPAIEGLHIEQQVQAHDLLDGGQRTQIYRIAQEALANAVRHSRARRISVEWRVFDDGQGVMLRISDDGRGFDPEAVKPGRFGMPNMRSRAHDIGASLTLRTALGQGCEWLLRLHLATTH